MAPLTKNPALKWTAPLVAAALAVGIPVAMSASASAEPPLPEKTAQELLVDVQALKNLPISGDVTTVANLGLPQLPGFAAPTVSDVSLGSLLTLASGTHTWRVWNDGAQASRVALLTGQSETDVIRNGSEVWVWSSADRHAVHSTLPDGADKGTHVPGNAPDGTPAELAGDLLKAIDPTTAVTVGRASHVAGRPAYELVLTPKQTGTKIGKITLALDSKTKVPLRVQVIAHDGTLAAEVAFTSVSFAKPDAGVFEFTPPSGTEVTEGPAGGTMPEAPAGTAPTEPPAGTEPKPTPTKPATSGAEPKVIGTGWTTIVVADPGPAPTDNTDGTVGALFDQLPQVSGSWGTGRLFDGSLVSVVLTDDGRVAAGAVTPDALYAALKG